MADFYLVRQSKKGPAISIDWIVPLRQGTLPLDGPNPNNDPLPRDPSVRGTLMQIIRSRYLSVRYPLTADVRQALEEEGGYAAYEANHVASRCTIGLSRRMRPRGKWTGSTSKVPNIQTHPFPTLLAARSWMVDSANARMSHTASLKLTCATEPWRVLRGGLARGMSSCPHPPDVPSAPSGPFRPAHSCRQCCRTCFPS